MTTHPTTAIRSTINTRLLDHLLNYGHIALERKRETTDGTLWAKFDSEHPHDRAQLYTHTVRALLEQAREEGYVVGEDQIGDPEVREAAWEPTED